MELIIHTAVSLLVIYLGSGILFGILFIWKGLSTVDENAKNSSIYFKLIIFPGVVLFWPRLLANWINKR